MPMKLDLSNLLDLFSSLSPLLVSFLLVMISLFNQNVKGLIYLSGVLITSLLNLIVGFTLNKIKYSDAAPICDFIGIPYLTNFRTNKTGLWV